MVSGNLKWIMACCFALSAVSMNAQSFYFGADLSYVNEMEDCGAVYTVQSEPEDAYGIFKDHGCNLVRLRLWHTPSWYDGLNQGHRYSDFEDVRLSIMRAKAEGMDVLLAFHLSDTWADPSHQVAPLAWWNILDSLSILQDSLYNYVYFTLQQLAEEQLLPAIIQIGNETNKDILLSQQVNDEGWTLSWPRNSALFNSAISAVRDIESVYGQEIEVALHIANPSEVGWYMQQFWANDVRDFEIIGFSYYWQFHNVLFDDVGNTISALRNNYPGKKVMILETAYPWTTGNADGANNILFSAYPGYTPHSPAQQKRWMVDLTQIVMDHGGHGVIYWEPAWVSTGCSTQWAQGSHWDNATFFNTAHELMEGGGIGWMMYPYVHVAVEREPWASAFYYMINPEGNEIWIYRNAYHTKAGEIGVRLSMIDGRRVYECKSFPEWVGGRYVVEIPGFISGVYILTIAEANVFRMAGLVVKN